MLKKSRRWYFTTAVSLPPATKLGQGYVFTGICDSVNRGGTPHTPPPGSRHPPEQIPREQTPPTRVDNPLGADTPQHKHPPWSRHPLVADPPGADTPQSRHPSQEQTPPSPRRAYCEIRSTRVRYASYWNAILFCPYNDNQPVFRMTILSGFHDSHSYSKWQITRQFLTIKIILREWISDPISIRIDKFE